MQRDKAQGRVMSRWPREPSGALPGLRESSREDFLKPLALRPDDMVAEQGWQGRHGGYSGQREPAEHRDEVLKQAGCTGKHTVQFCWRMKGKGKWSGWGAWWRLEMGRSSHKRSHLPCQKLSRSEKVTEGF